MRMPISKVYANLSCADLGDSATWFATIFGRPADRAPMTGLQEWDCGDGGFQLFQKPEDAGRGTLTLMVDDLEAERARLETAGLSMPGIETADYTDIMRLRDPDGNLVVLAHPHPG